MVPLATWITSVSDTPVDSGKEVAHALLPCRLQHVKWEGGGVEPMYSERRRP